MKKLMSLVLALAMILSLAACGGKTTGTSPDSAGDSQQETPATSDGAFPEKQITIIMPWSLGGGPDTIARQVASYGEKYLGVPVIVENHTGGSGTIAMNDALQAAESLCRRGEHNQVRYHRRPWQRQLYYDFRPVQVIGHPR